MQLHDLQVILEVAKLESISAAALKLDISAATASAAVKRVEKALGVELFVRTTRQLRLSSAGERYLPKCQQGLELLEQARLSTCDECTGIRGELRIAVPSDLGRNVFMPWLDAFMASHPELAVKLHISDSPSDFYRDRIDVALRYGAPLDSNHTGFEICQFPRLLCASPEFLTRHGTPEHPDQLANFNGLFYQVRDLTYDMWEFIGPDGQHHKVKMNGDRAANDADLVRRWCLAGRGLATKSYLDIAEHLLAGELVAVMPEYRQPNISLWLICPSRHSVTPAIRQLRDYLRERTGEVLQKLSDAQLL